jgi:hypothetical protein
MRLAAGRLGPCLVTTNDVKRRPEDALLRQRGPWARPEWMRIIKKK